MKTRQFIINEMKSYNHHHHTHTHREGQTDGQSAVALRGEAWCCCFDRFVINPFTLHYHSAEWTASYSQQSRASALYLFKHHRETDFGHICLLTATRDYYYRAVNCFPTTKLEGKFIIWLTIQAGLRGTLCDGFSLPRALPSGTVEMRLIHWEMFLMDMMNQMAVLHLVI